MKILTRTQRRYCHPHLNAIQIAFLIAAAATLIHGHQHVPNNRIATITKIKHNARPSTTNTLSPVQIGLRSAFLNMFGGLPISSPSAVDASAAFTRGSMPIPYGVHQQQSSSQQDASFPNLDFKTKTRQRQRTNRWQRTKTSSSSKVKRSATSSSTVAAPTPTTSTSPPSTTVTSPNSLTFVECMICGAISRTISQTLTHPADTMKTLLQLPQNDPNTQKTTIAILLKPHNFSKLMRGAGAKMVLSIPLGALNFAVLEYTKKSMDRAIAKQQQLASKVEKKNGAVKKAGVDFLSSSLSTITCSVLSTPQTVIMDNIMAGRYPNLIAAISGLGSTNGIMSFYKGWKPSIVKQIPSYGLTWVFFEQLKTWHNATFNRPLKNVDNLMIGGVASAASVCIMIPMDTIKTRMVLTSASQTAVSSQIAAGGGAGNIAVCVPYKGITDCASRIIKEEGVGALYRGLTPRLMSVVPMIGIQFGVYEFMKKMYLNRKVMDEDENTNGSSRRKREHNERIDRGKSGG